MRLTLGSILLSRLPANIITVAVAFYLIALTSISVLDSVAWVDRANYLNTFLLGCNNTGWPYFFDGLACLFPATKKGFWFFVLSIHTLSALSIIFIVVQTISRSPVIIAIMFCFWLHLPFLVHLRAGLGLFLLLPLFVTVVRTTQGQSCSLINLFFLIFLSLVAMGTHLIHVPLSLIGILAVVFNGFARKASKHAFLGLFVAMALIHLGQADIIERVSNVANSFGYKGLMSFSNAKPQISIKPSSFAFSFLIIVILSHFLDRAKFRYFRLFCLCVFVICSAVVWAPLLRAVSYTIFPLTLFIFVEHYLAAKVGFGHQSIAR